MSGDAKRSTAQQLWELGWPRETGREHRVTLYNAQGDPIEYWDEVTRIERTGIGFRFVADGREVEVAGTVVVREEPDHAD